MGYSSLTKVGLDGSKKTFFLSEFREYYVPAEQEEKILTALQGRPGYIYSGWNGGHNLNIYNISVGWKVSDASVGHTHKEKFSDQNGEARTMDAYDFIKNVILRNCSSWDDYDKLLQAEELEMLKETAERGKYSREENYKKIDSLSSEIDSLRMLLNEVYDINERKGPKSRKKVRDLLLKIVELCEECGNANCACE